MLTLSLLMTQLPEALHSTGINLLVCPTDNTIFYVWNTFDALMQPKLCRVVQASIGSPNLMQTVFHLLDPVTKSCFHSVDFVIKIVKTFGKGAVKVSDLVGDSN